MQPFGNSLVRDDPHRRAAEGGARVAEPSPAIRSFLQPSEGFTYTWQSDARARGMRVRDMRLDGEPIEPEPSYRITREQLPRRGRRRLRRS